MIQPEGLNNNCASSYRNSERGGLLRCNSSTSPFGISGSKATISCEFDCPKKSKRDMSINILPEVKPASLVCFLSITFFALIPLSSSAFNPLVQKDVCRGLLNPMTCQAFRNKAETAQSIATADRKKWEKIAFFLIENAPPPYQLLLNGSLLNIYDGKLKTAKVPLKSKETYSQIVITQWRLYIDIIFQFNLKGILTFDVYPCNASCEGHTQGYDWAESNNIKQYKFCENEEKSFTEGCYVWVTRGRGLIFAEIQN